MSQFYFLPKEYISDDHAALGLCISSLLYLIKMPGSEPYDLFTAKAIFDRVFNGTGQGGESIALWEISRWKHRGLTELGLVSGAFDDEALLVWVDETAEVNPSWRVYGEEEFKYVFQCCCSNYIAENPLCAKEVSKALMEHGMNLPSQRTS